jgi:hypothetical protein
MHEFMIASCILGLISIDRGRVAQVRRVRFESPAQTNFFCHGRDHQFPIRSIDAPTISRRFSNLPHSCQVEILENRFHPCDVARSDKRAGGGTANPPCPRFVVCEPGYGKRMIAWPQLSAPAILGCITELGAALPLEGNGCSSKRSSPAKFAMAVMAARSC